jgi:predicted  nucleic acid-binding Zn-ribbon protein
MLTKTTTAVCLVLASLGAYIGVASLAQLRAYDTEIITLVSEINALKEQMHQLREEDRELYVKLDQTQKSLTKLQEENRIQEVLINEARAKRKK